MLSKSQIYVELAEIWKGAKDWKRNCRDADWVVSIAEESPVVLAFTHVNYVNVT